MQQSEGFIETNSEYKVCKFNKTICGLKQAATVWYNKIDKSLKNINFVKSTADAYLFTRKENENFTNIIVYSDNILIASKDDINQDIKNQLQKECGVKDLGEISHYLKTNIVKTNDGFKLN